jgi:hypothetical protein
MPKLKSLYLDLDEEGFVESIIVQMLDLDYLNGVKVEKVNLAEDSDNSLKTDESYEEEKKEEEKKEEELPDEKQIENIQKYAPRDDIIEELENDSGSAADLNRAKPGEHCEPSSGEDEDIERAKISESSEEEKHQNNDFLNLHNMSKDNNISYSFNQDTSNELDNDALYRQTSNRQEPSSAGLMHIPFITDDYNTKLRKSKSFMKDPLERFNIPFAELETKQPESLKPILKY